MLANPTAKERGANARMGDEDAAEALSATGRLEGSVGETLRGEPPDDPRMGRDGSVGPGPVVRGWAILATSSRAPQAGSLHRDRRGTSRGVPRSVGEASVRRGPRGGLPRWLQPCAGLRPRGTPARAGRGGGAVRDAGGASGPGGLRDVHAALGPPARPGRGAEPLPAAVAALLPPTDDGGADRGAGARVRAVRRCPEGALVRPRCARSCCRTAAWVAANWC